MSLRTVLAVAPLADEVIVLRRPEPHDVDALRHHVVHDDAKAWLSGAGDAEELLAGYVAGWVAPDERHRLGLTLAVARVSDDKLVGLVHLEPRGAVLAVSYGVAPEHRRSGVASRALRLCAAWALAHGFAEVELEIGENNEPSQRVARRCGFSPTDRTRRQRLPDGGWWSARTWSLPAVPAQRTR